MTAFAQESRIDFAPPPAPGRLASPLLAVAAHAVLILALTLSVQWRHQTPSQNMVAELWSEAPVQATPRLVEEPAVPETPPAPPPPPVPEPPVVKSPPAPPLPSAADIALEREKLKKVAEERKREERLQLQKQEQKLAQEKAEKALKAEKAEKAEKEKRERELAERQKAERDKLEKAKLEKTKLAQQDDKNKAKSAAEAKALEQERKRNLDQMMAKAGAAPGGTGDPSSTGTALRSAGPSASYTGRVIARVKPNIVFADDISGNPSAEVEVRTAPDGTITGRRLIKSSGHKAWDEAVLKALDKTEVLPRDEGRPPPSPMLMVFRPRD